MSKKLRPEPKLSVAKRQPPRWQRERNIVLVVWIIIPLIIALALSLVGYWTYNTYVGVWRQPVVQISKTVLGNETGNQTIIGNDTIVRMDYYVKMLRLYAVATENQNNTAYLPYQTLSQIENDELTRRAASYLDIQVSPGNITQEISDSIRSSGEGNLTDAELNEVYQQWLDRVRLSDAEYRQVVEAMLLRERIREYFKQQKVPAETEQIHIHAIIVADEGNATEVRNRLLSGGNFSALAQEFSIDETSRQYGGDLGWVPKGILYSEIENVAFNLQIGNVSEPIIASDGYYIVMVSERDESRQIAEEYREILAAKEFDRLLIEFREASKIEEYLDQNKINWALDRI